MGARRNTPFTRYDHPLPTPFWHWLDREWMVDMSGDTDEQGTSAAILYCSSPLTLSITGWSYAVRFGSRHWRGQPEVWRSFVRRRRWIRARVYLPKPLPNLSKSERDPSHVDWEALHNSEFADRSTPHDDVGDRPSDEVFAMGLKGATALLPLSAARKDEIFGWEQEIDAHQPFLAWSSVKYEGERTLVQRRQRDPAGSRSDEELFGIWRDAVIEINFRKIARVLKACRLDREKLGLWRWWLGLPVEPEVGGGEEQGSRLYESPPDSSRASSMRAPNGRPSSGVDANAWETMDPRPMLDDVWDLLEGRVSIRAFSTLLLPLADTASFSSTLSFNFSSSKAPASTSSTLYSPSILSSMPTTAISRTTAVNHLNQASSRPSSSALAWARASTFTRTSRNSCSSMRVPWVIR